MKTNKKLNDRELDNVSGGNSNLDKYLKSLAGNDSDKPLIDYGTGVQLDHDSSTQYDKNENLLIVKREKDPMKE